jgi:hypothetical protein
MEIRILSLMLLLFGTLSGAAPAQQQCVVENEEYAVLAAILFPNPAEIPPNMKTDIEKQAYLAAQDVRLDGFHGSSYTIEDQSMPAKISKSTDPQMVQDFNRRNESHCKWTAEKLLSHLPSGKTTAFVKPKDAGEISSLAPGRGEEAPGQLRSTEITRLSRPGFNKARTQAVAEVDLIADPEMGVGYRVYLQKSPKTGKWILTSAERTRMY